MASTPKYECVVCKAERKQTNHWFLVYAPSSPDESIVILAFTFEDADRVDAQCICGRNCLNRWIDEELNKLIVPTGLSIQELDRIENQEYDELPPVKVYSNEEERIWEEARTAMDYLEPML